MRLRFRFSLRQMFMGVALAAVLSFVGSQYYHVYLNEPHCIQDLAAVHMYNHLVYESRPPWWCPFSFGTMFDLPVDVTLYQCTDRVILQLCSCGRDVKRLSIYDSPALSAVSLRQLTHLSSLEDLTIWNSELRSESLVALAPLMPQLRQLTFAEDENLNDAWLTILERANRLAVFRIYGCDQVSTKTLKMLPPTIRVLHLCAINISDDSVPEIKRFSNLEELDIVGSTITEKGFETLNDAFGSRVHITHE